jgi:hypothetical protein
MDATENRREPIDGGSMQSGSSQHGSDNRQQEASETAAGTGEGSQKVDEGTQERGTREDWERSAVAEPGPAQPVGTQLRGTREDWERGVKVDTTTQAPGDSPSTTDGQTADDTTARKEQVTLRDGSLSD